MNSNLQIRLLMWALLSLQLGCTARAVGPAAGPVSRSGGGHASTGSGMHVHPPCFWSLSAACREVGWQGAQGSAALQVIGSLTAPPTLAPLLSQVCRTQIQRYQRATAAERGPAGSSHPLCSPSLTWSGGWTWRWLCFAARLFLGIATDGRCRERAGCRAGACWELCWGAQRGARRCRQLGAGTLPAVLTVPACLPACLPGSLSPSPAPLLPGGHGVGRLPADTAILPLLPTGCERGASSGARLIRGQLFCACDGSHRALCQGPHAPWPRCPPPAWTASPCLP